MNKHSSLSSISSAREETIPWRLWTLNINSAKLMVLHEFHNKLKRISLVQAIYSHLSLKDMAMNYVAFKAVPSSKA